MDVAMKDVTEHKGIPATKQIVHVEVCLKESSTADHSEITRRVHSYLQKEVPLLSPGALTFLKDEVLWSHVASATTCLPGSMQVALFCSEVVINVYQLTEEEASEEIQETADGQEEMVAANAWMIPNRHFEGLWESLIFDIEIKKNLLDYATSAMLFADKHVNSQLVVWNRVVLLHGPPGTGKTSLCKALAHKLAIRLSDRYQYAQLLEINSHSLFSKWFSESGKLVQQLFARIGELVEDKTTLVCVLIDEVESLTAARTSALNGSEPSDSIRVVNALLTQLDQLKRHENVMILTTSNITAAMDIAFVDRADIKQYIGLPGVCARYEILRSCLKELQRVGIITQNEEDMLENYMPKDSLRLAKSGCVTTSDMLFEVAVLCKEFSGRALRKLPFQAHALFVQITLCSMKDFLDALQKAIRKEISEKQRLASSKQSMSGCY